MENVIKNNIKEMRNAATLLEEMRSVYPGDIDNTLGTEAYLLNKAASWLERIDWDKEAERFTRASAGRNDVALACFRLGN